MIDRDRNTLKEASQGVESKVIGFICDGKVTGEFGNFDLADNDEVLHVLQVAMTRSLAHLLSMLTVSQMQAVLEHCVQQAQVIVNSVEMGRSTHSTERINLN